MPLCTGHRTECSEDKEALAPLHVWTWPLNPSDCFKCLHYHTAVSAHLTQLPRMYLLLTATFCLCSATYLLLSILYCIYIHSHTAKPLLVAESFAWLTATHFLRLCSGLIVSPDSPVWIRHASSVCPKCLVCIHILALTMCCAVLSHSVMSDSLRPHRL